ncbi:MAG: K+/H+ antiporter subunit F [Betaproteobacteria bacterium]|nr:K+/H+ antiporter subunit F [Betaproteobacteria bacterium]
MLNIAMAVATVFLSVALFATVWRLVRGPGACDRLLAVDTLYLNIAGLVLVLGVKTRSTLYFEVALLIVVLGFVATVAGARLLERRALIE